MTLPSFPSTGTGDGTPAIYEVGGQNTGTSDGLVTLVYGTNVSDAVTYTISAVIPGVTLVSSAIFTNLRDTIHLERTRRGTSTVIVSIVSPIGHDLYNTLISNLNVSGPNASQAYNTNGSVDITTYPQLAAPSLPSTLITGSVITAACVNTLIDSITAAGGACTCNCNYCTCNCNYSCTCNCNYSDERVKTEIEYM